MIEPFKTLNKGMEWILHIPEYLSELGDKIIYTASVMHQSYKSLRWTYKTTVHGLVEDTTLTKKQAKKIVGDAMEFVVHVFEKDEDRLGPYGYFETNLLVIYSIRGNKDYAEEVHQYCDDDLQHINEMVNEDIDDRDEWLSIGLYKRLNVLIDKYQNSFDKRRESKKYNGIWY